MLSIAKIRQKSDRLWPKLLTATTQGRAIFPHSVPLVAPKSSQLGEQFSAIRQWIKEVDSFAERYQLQVIRKTINHRQLGPQTIPTKLLFGHRDKLLALIGKVEEFAVFENNLKLLETELPGLCNWVRSNTGQIVKHAAQWPQLIAVVQYFQAHPRPEQYLRELSIAGIDSKFIESNLGILRQLLTLCLDQQQQFAEFENNDLGDFCRCFGLKYDQPTIRFRWLDSRPQRIPLGLADISIPLSDFSKLKPTIDTVFITENKTNGLAFPAFDNAIIIFGYGYGISVLSEVEWLKGKTVYYWGDVDTRGFHILAQLRCFLPASRSLLMDRETLLSSKEMWGYEPASARYQGALPQLNTEEQLVYLALIDNEYQQCLRMEQERIAFDLLEKHLAEL